MRITSNGESKKRAVRLNYSSDRSVRASARRARGLIPIIHNDPFMGVILPGAAAMRKRPAPVKHRHGTSYLPMMT